MFVSFSLLIVFLIILPMIEILVWCEVYLIYKNFVTFYEKVITLLLHIHVMDYKELNLIYLHFNYTYFSCKCFLNSFMLLKMMIP